MELYSNLYEEWGWSADFDFPHVYGKCLSLNDSDINNLYRFAHIVSKKYEGITDYIINNNLLGDLGIPESIIKAIKGSWLNKHPFLYGRFDVTNPIYPQLIEFNADCAGFLAETAILGQYEGMYEGLVYRFSEIKNMFPNKENTILFTCGMDDKEAMRSIDVLMAASHDAGFQVKFDFIHNVIIDKNGIFIEQSQDDFVRFDFVFKMVRWEDFAAKEPELTRIIGNLIENDMTIFMNPPYSMVWENKKTLQYVWEKFKDNFLIETSDIQLIGKKHIGKPVNGLRGSNVTIFDEKGDVVCETDGDFRLDDKIFQEFVELPLLDGKYTQTNVFMIGNQPNGISFRCDKSPILSDDSEIKFVEKN